jgi:hypothetical protein
MYSLRDVLFMVVCGTIASGDVYCGKAHPALLRAFISVFPAPIGCAAFMLHNRGNRRRLRRTHNHRKALHLVPAFAIN